MKARDSRGAGNQQNHSQKEKTMSEPNNDDQPEQKPLDLKFDIDPKVGESLQGGLDALGQVFGGLVGAIKDAVGPEVMKGIEVAGWLEQLTTCLESIAAGLRSDGIVPADAVGQLTFFAEQFDSAIAGSKLEAQKELLTAKLRMAQQVIDGVNNDPTAAAETVTRVAGYFKAAAASCVPVPKGKESE